MEILIYKNVEFRRYLNTNIYSNEKGDIISSNFKRTEKIGFFKQSISRKYLRITTNLNGKSVCLISHRLIATCWIENHDNKPQVNHINGIKTDNRVENLEWVSAKENSIHAYKTCLSIQEKGEKHFHFGKRGKETNRAKKVLNKKTGKIYDCLKDAQLDSEYSYKNLSRQLTGERKNKTNFVYVN